MIPAINTFTDQKYFTIYAAQHGVLIEAGDTVHLPTSIAICGVDIVSGAVFVDTSDNEIGGLTLPGGEPYGSVLARECVITAVHGQGSKGVNLSLEESTIVDLDLDGASISHLYAREVDVMEAHLDSAVIGSADFVAARFHSGLNAAHSQLRDADFRSANLRGSDFVGADLTGADFRYADLTHADFRNADLRRSLLPDYAELVADLTGARLPETFVVC